MERCVGIWGHCAMTEKVHLEDLIPLTTESSDEMREGKGEGGVEPGGKRQVRVVGCFIPL